MLFHDQTLGTVWNSYEVLQTANAKERRYHVRCDIAQTVESQTCGRLGCVGNLYGVTVAVFGAETEIVSIDMGEIGEIVQCGNLHSLVLLANE